MQIYISPLSSYQGTREKREKIEKVGSVVLAIKYRNLFEEEKKSASTRSSKGMKYGCALIFFVASIN